MVNSSKQYSLEDNSCRPHLKNVITNILLAIEYRYITLLSMSMFLFDPTFHWNHWYSLEIESNFQWRWMIFSLFYCCISTNFLLVFASFEFKNKPRNLRWKCRSTSFFVSFQFREAASAQRLKSTFFLDFTSLYSVH